MENKSYGFDFNTSVFQAPTNIFGIGHERQTRLSYYWDGKKTPGEGSYVFQYTLAGSGQIKIKNELYELKKNDAFWVKNPSDYVYYLPKESESWEFIYITIYGDAVNQLFDRLVKKHGHIYQIDQTNALIEMLMLFINQLRPDHALTVYQTAEVSYRFLMQLAQTLEYEQRETFVPEPILKVMHYLEQAYHTDVDIDCLTKVSGLSPYHFIRIFKAHTGKTPIDYLTEKRTREATKYLVTTDLSIEAIAIAVGYQNGNYFTKVFKKQMRLTPSAYRKEKRALGERHWFIK